MNAVGRLLQWMGFAQKQPPSDPGDDWWYSPIGLASASGINVDEYTSLTYSACYAATRLLSGTTAMLPLNLVEVRSVAGRQVSAIAMAHPVQDIIHTAPNAEMGSTAWRASQTKHQINCGNCYAEIVTNDGRPVSEGGTINSLWPIHPSRVEARRDRETRQLFYRVKNDPGAETAYTDFMPNELLHIPSMMSSDGITGIGVITAARQSIGLGIAVEMQGAAYFKNSARPSVVIKGGKFKDERAREWFRETWVNVHGGPEQNARPAMLPPDADISVLSFSPEDSQFLQTRQHNIEEVARWYGVPPHMIGHLLRATFSNIEHQSIEFVQYSLMPWLVLWEREINRKLLSPIDRRRGLQAKFNVNALLRGDNDSRSKFYQIMWERGVFSTNDIRELEDMNPVEGGEKRYVPMNYALLTDDPEDSEESAEPDATSADDGDAERDEQMARMMTLLDQLDKRLSEPLPQQGSTSMTGDRRALLRAAETLLTATLRRMLAKELRAVHGAASRPPREFMQWLNQWYDNYEVTLRDALREPYEAYRIAAGISYSFDDVIKGHLAHSLNSILLETEIPAEDWHTMPDRISGLNWSERPRLALAKMDQVEAADDADA